MDKFELDLYFYISLCFTSLVQPNFEQGLLRKHIIYYSFSNSSLKILSKWFVEDKSQGIKLLEVMRTELTSFCTVSYSSSYNLTPAISRVLIGRHLIFCSLTWPTCCKLPWICTQVKYKARQKAGFPVVTQPHMVLLDGWVKFCVI